MRLEVVMLPVAGLLLANGAIAQSRPNVIIILADDQGYGDMSCHGNPLLKTPAMDMLRDQSVCLTDFHVAPMSTPTRGELLTGRDAMKNGATAVCQGASLLREDIPTMADMFQAAGYRTVHYGKWHLGDSYPYRPQDRGFQETIHFGAFGIGSIADDYRNKDYWNGYFRDQMHEVVETQGYSTDVWFDFASQYVKKRAQDKEPFMMYLALNCAHAPHWVDKEYSDRYMPALIDKDSVLAQFFGQVANIDDNLGRFVKLLDDINMRENTILIYMTDNGTVKGHEFFNAGMRGHKTEVWEGGHRVPFFISWPAGGLKPCNIDELTHVQDVLPTLLDFCSIPQAKDVEFDGVSLAALMRGQEKKLEDRMLVVDYGASREESQSVVMWNKWRYLHTGELYNVADDPHQDHNVANKYPDITRKLKDYYAQWWKETQPSYEKIRYIRVGNPKSNPTPLYSNDWTGSYADNQGNLRNIRNRFGYWPVIVESDGNYRISVARWWFEAKAPISGLYDERAPMPKAALQEIVSATLLLDGKEVETKQVSKTTTEVSFELSLKKGNLNISSQFQDKNGKAICSAPYMLIEKL